MIKSVLAVCIGNICRSPLAEAALAQRLQGHIVASAGVGALVDHGADPLAIEVGAEAGLDLSAHRATQFDRSHVDRFDLILVMTRREKQWIAERFPEATGRTFLLGHWRDGLEVPDPYQHPRGAFEQALAMITELSDSWVERLPPQ